MFSGRYKSILIDGSGTGYLKSACDYVHLNPVRAGLLKSEDRLIAFPWSSFGLYLAAREHRPSWVRVDRLLGEHGIQQDTALYANTSPDASTRVTPMDLWNRKPGAQPANPAVEAHERFIIPFKNPLTPPLKQLTIPSV